MTPVAVLAVETANQTRHITPPASGLTIGSSKTSGLQIPDSNVLPEHARLYKDPLGRWIIECVDPAGRINVNGRVGNTFSINSGDRIRIGISTLQLIETEQPSIIPNAVVTTPVTFADAGERQTLTNEDECYAEFSRSHLEELDRIADCLGTLTEAQALYPVVCDHLSDTVDTVALVVKVPKGTEPVNQSRILCQRGKLIQPYSSASAGSPRTLQNVRLSQTVLDSVRQKKTAFLATSAPDVDGPNDARLSFIGDMPPRMVLAAPIAETSTGIDILYVDQPAMSFRTDALGFFAVVARMISLSRKSLIMAEYKAERTALNNQLSTALEIQSNLMPRSLNLFDEVEVALYYKPAGWVGGDYCDLIRTSDDRLMFAVGDVSGKGMPAAMMMANVHSMIRSMVLFSNSPTEIVQKMNSMLCDTLLDRMFITLLLCFLNPRTGEVEYVNAGHELPLLISSNDGSVKVLGSPANMPLGIQHNRFESQFTTLTPGDGLMLISDGVPDTFSSGDEKFGYDRLLQSVGGMSRQPCDKIVRNVVSSINGFRQSHPQGDDITMLALRWKRS